MKILQFQGKHPNFGDELNTWLWPKLLPNFFDEDESTEFIGIGSTIGDAPKTAARKVVCGAGYVSAYHERPDITHGEWDVAFVRGPRTANTLGLDPKLALGDSAILLRTVKNFEKTNPQNISFMPHWESMERGNWEAVCKAAGIHLIDPRKPVVKVMEELLASKLVIAEAMHGAIVADAFRIPWVPVVPLNAVHRDKWYDWAESLDLTLTPQRLWPSKLTELSLESMAAPTQNAAVEVTEHYAPKRRSLASRAKGLILRTPFATMADDTLVDLAAYRLTQLSKIEPQLSRDSKIADITSRMQEKMEMVKRTYAA